MYLRTAMRALGETMHLVADMTQPAHVRNDSHPGWEVTEDAVTGASASALTKYTRVDGLVGLPLGNQVRDIMQTLSTYVNARFYSEDTIADAASGVLPRNGETPYANPNFSLFTAKTELGDMIYSQNFGGKRIPMLRKEPGTLYGYNHVIPVEYVPDGLAADPGTARRGGCGDAGQGESGRRGGSPAV